MKRRTFLGSLLATAAFPLGGATRAPGHAPVGEPRLDRSRADRPRFGDPRLTARPARPFVEVVPGITRFGENLPRGGLLYVPASYSPDVPAPLIVALHGSGGQSGSWSRLYEACETHGIVMVAPDSRGRTWDRIQDDFGPDVAFIDAALRFVFERCVVDPGHLALAGFSDGATYALSLGPSNGDLFTHLIAWSPGFSAPDDPIVGSPRVFVSHGTADRVLPVGLSRGGIVPMFEMDGYAIEYLEFDGAHEMPPEVIASTMTWFLAV